MSGMRHRKGEIVEIYRRVDAPLKRIFPHQQLQKGRLAAAIAADEAQLPVAVELKARLFKNIVVAARIGKAQVGYLDLRHVVSSLKKKSAAGNIPRLYGGHGRKEARSRKTAGEQLSCA